MWRQVSTYKFKAAYETKNKMSTIEGPTKTSENINVVNVTGSGALTLTCGLVPRLNALVYDGIGMFVGVRAALIAEGKYESSCKSDPKDSRPSARIDLGLVLLRQIQMEARTDHGLERHGIEPGCFTVG